MDGKVTTFTVPRSLEMGNKRAQASTRPGYVSELLFTETNCSLTPGVPSQLAPASLPSRARALLKIHNRHGLLCVLLNTLIN